jgi:hypothetical protein
MDHTVVFLWDLKTIGYYGVCEKDEADIDEYFITWRDQT